MGDWKRFSRLLILGWVAAAQFLAGVSVAFGQQLSAAPVFALNTPYHAGFVLHLAVTPDEREVVTAGFDKTIRVWDVQSGDLLRRFYLPLRDGGDGRITALGLSPDGEQLALGGGLFGFGKGKAVIVVSPADGRIVHTIGGFNLSPRTVSWSKDGGLLAVGMDGHEGPSRIHVFETATWNKVFDDRDVRGRVDAIEFRRDGVFFATTNNGTIDSEVFLYRPEGKTFRRVVKKSVGDRGAYRAAWTADETHLYVGGHSYLSGEDLTGSPWPESRRTPKAEGFIAMRDAPDGAAVYAAFWGRSADSGRLRRFRDRGLRTWDEVAIPDGRVTDFAILRSGPLIYVSHDGAVAAIGPDFKPLWRQAGPSPWFLRVAGAAEGLRRRPMGHPAPAGTGEGRRDRLQPLRAAVRAPLQCDAEMGRADDLAAGGSTPGVA